jgi:hypothetical protein
MYVFVSARRVQIPKRAPFNDNVTTVNLFPVEDGIAFGFLLGAQISESSSQRPPRRPKRPRRT